MFVDDTAVRAPSRGLLLHTLDTLHDVAHTRGLRFNRDKTEVYPWAKDHNLEHITWQRQLIPVRPPIITYLGHVLAHFTQEDTVWDMVTTQRYHDIAAYRTLPLNAYEKVAIINAVLIPRWTYRWTYKGAVPREQIPDGTLGRHTPTLHQGHSRDRTTNEQTPTHNNPKPRGTRPAATMVVVHHQVDHTRAARATKQRHHTATHRNSRSLSPLVYLPLFPSRAVCFYFLFFVP